MSFAFYIYTTIIMGVALVTSAVALVVWLMTRRRDSLVAAAGFLLYMLDMSVIFFDEYTRLKYDYAVTFSEPLQHPLLRCVLGIAIYACIVLWMFARLRKRPTSRMLGLAIVPFSILQLLLVPRSGAAGEVQQYLFWLTRDLGNVGCLAYAAWHYRHRATRVEKLDLDRSKLFWKVALVLAFCVIAEDTYMILLCRPDSQNPVLSLFLWYLSERNISENVLLVVCAVQLFCQFSYILRVYARHPRADEDVAAQSASSEDDLASRVVIYADAHKLSRREQEVLTLVLKGNDAQNIASELVISPGTVKAHLHRIYVKSGVSNRDDLIDTFWRS